MKNSNQSGRKLRFATSRQRMLSLLMFAVFATLVWLAWSGRSDVWFYQVAAWLDAL